LELKEGGVCRGERTKRPKNPKPSGKGFWEKSVDCGEMNTMGPEHSKEEGGIKKGTGDAHDKEKISTHGKVEFIRAKNGAGADLWNLLRWMGSQRMPHFLKMGVPPRVWGRHQRHHEGQLLTVPGLFKTTQIKRIRGKRGDGLRLVLIIGGDHLGVRF